MIILKKGYQIDADERQYILQQVRKVKPKNPTDEPKEAVDVVGYYKGLSDCLQAVLRYEGYDLVRGKQMTLQEAIDALKDLQREVHSWFDGLEVER